MVHLRQAGRRLGVHMAVIRAATFLGILALALSITGCGAGGGDKIEPSSKGGSPILNRSQNNGAGTTR